MSEPSRIAENVAEVLQAIHDACARSGRAQDSVQLVAISKNQSFESMRLVAKALRDRGSPVVFGENYVQEYEKKHASVGSLSEAVHFTGTLQSNKAARAVELFDTIQSVHSEKIARAISKECVRIGLKRRVLLQVNISGDPSKSGFSPKALREFLLTIPDGLDGLSIDGLMTITAHYEGESDTVRRDFRMMRELLVELLDTEEYCRLFSARQLSMGMSSDYPIAIEEGATIVRVGTALFGARE